MLRQPAIILPDPWVPPYPYEEIIPSLSLTDLSAGTLVASGNDAHYVPIVFPVSCTIYSLRFAGANTTGNYDLGLYDSSLNRIASTGSTALTAAVKTLSLPDIRVRAGTMLYAALALSSTTGQIIRANYGIGALRGFGWGTQASALPLPSTASPGSAVAYSVIPLFSFGVR